MNNVNMNITTVTKGVVCHGVNCRRAMGSGVALAIKTKWPEIYTSYMSCMNKLEGPGMLGFVDIIEVGPELHVANCYTQVDYAGYNKDWNDDILAIPEAIEEALDGAFAFASVERLPIYLPLIASGLGGLDWLTEVFPIVDGLAKHYEYEDVETTICIWP